MTGKQKDLCVYRLSRAEETVKNAELSLKNSFFRDAINRSYYAAFYAVKAVLALADVDFKRHKDVVAYFNKNYIASGDIEGTVGRLLSRLQRKRETSDYDDFFVSSYEEASEQIRSAKEIIKAVKEYIDQLL